MLPASCCSILLLAVITIFGLIISLRHYNLVLVDEMKALVSVTFGFALSCLLLSFIWIIQREPAPVPWPGSPGDAPSMHPRGRSASVSSSELDPQRLATVCTITMAADRPPNYEDALISSKPVNCIYLEAEKSCPKHRDKQAEGANTDLNPPAGSTTSQCHMCQAEVMDLETGQRQKIQAATGSTSVAQLAMSIVRTFASLDPSSALEDQNQSAGDNRRESQRGQRKLSYQALDVNQLTMSGSPPKYHELSLGGFLADELGSQSNEPSAGGHT